MWYIMIFCIGFLAGFVVAAIMSASGHSDQMQEAYNRGYECGIKNAQSKNIED